MESSHWRCGSCNARFVDEAPSPRCPKCLKRSLIAPAEPVAPPVYEEAVERVQEPSAEEQDKTAGRALVFATMPALIAAFLVSGWFGFRVDPMIALLVAVGTAPIAGWLVAKSLGERVFASIASMIAAVGIVIATTWYIRDRRHLVNLELLLPMIIGGLPGLVVFYAFRATANVPVLRALLAFAAIVAAVVLVTSC
jgi:hypothetical protein